MLPMCESLFESLVQENFSFLVEKYGFHVNNTNAMHWSRGRYNVKLSYHRFELDLHLYYDDGGGLSSYSLCEVQQLTQLADIKDATYIYMASTPERLSLGIIQISSIFRNICEKLDIFNQETFDKLAIIRRKYSEECAMKTRILYFKEEEEKIWREKKYAELIELYENNNDILTTLEMKRLEYAKRNVIT